MNHPTLPLTTGFGLIRHAHPADSPRLIQMIGELAAHHGDSPTLTHADLQRDLFSTPPWIFVLVADTGDTLIGYAAMCGLIQLQSGARGMDLHHLFTDAAYRGQGVGRSLVEACQIAAIQSSCRYLSTSTHSENHAAQQFYLSQGFARKEGKPPRFTIQLTP